MESLYFVLCHISVVITITCSFFLFKRAKGVGSDLSLVGAFFSLASLAFLFWTITLYRYFSYPEQHTLGWLAVYLYLVTSAMLYPAKLLGSVFKCLSNMRFLGIYIIVIVLFGIYQTALNFDIEFSWFDPIESIANGTIFEFGKMFWVVTYLSTIALSLVMLIATLKYIKHDRIVREFVVSMQIFPLLMTFIFFGGDYSIIIALIGRICACVIVIYFTYRLIYRESKLLSFTPRVITSGVKPKRPKATGATEPQRADTSQLWKRLEEIMNSKSEPWRKRDLHVVDLVDLLHSNRTSISAEIHKHGYGSFYDYLATYRIAEFCRMVERGDVSNIVLALNRVGFHSSSSAFKQFKRIHGVTPTQYIAEFNASKE